MQPRIAELPPQVDALLAANGLDPKSFARFLEFVLTEHLISALSASVDSEVFNRLDALKQFRDKLRLQTGRAWSQHDLEYLFARVRQMHEPHFREPIRYEELLALLWQVPYECAWCHRKPPEVVLHIDHIVPASLGGTSHRDNLQLLCAEHNLRKSNKREVSEPCLDLR